MHQELQKGLVGRGGGISAGPGGARGEAARSVGTTRGGGMEESSQASAPAASVERGSRQHSPVLSLIKVAVGNGVTGSESQGEAGEDPTSLQ